MGLEDVVRKAAAAVEGVDLAAVELAATYGAAIDSGDSIDKVGPLLLAALESLLMTPKARASTAKGGADASGISNPLDELRARRSARVNDPSTVDTATAGTDA